ncbi:MAG: extracellular solute-binding protein, partial [Nocardioides sp.]|nr:extracellular solute-binding protein [Nocardioides sp.]
GLPSRREDVTKVFSSWDSYFQAGEAFHKKVPGVAWYDSEFIAQAMLNQEQFPFQTKDQKVDVDNPGLKKIFDTVAQHAPTLATRVVPWDDDWQAKMKAGQVATLPCPGWMFSNIKDNAPNVKGWDIADAFPGGGGNWGGSFLAVPKQSKHPKEAKQLANWLTDADQEVAAFKEAGNFPSNIAAETTLAKENATDPYFNNAPTNQILADRAKAVKPDLPYKGDKYADILGLFLPSFDRVDQGKPAAQSWATFTKAAGGLS